MNAQSSGSQTAIQNTWYTVNITVHNNKVNVTVRERATGTVKYDRRSITVDPLKDLINIRLSSFTPSTRSPNSKWDNFKVYNNSRHPNLPPEWLALPVFRAVEDVPFVQDFTSYVTDVDDRIGNLTLTQNSNFIIDISGLDVTFVFPNGVTEAEVRLTLRDRWNSVETTLLFNITPVNDAPEAFVPLHHTAEEGILYTFNATAFVRDIDDRTEDLWFEVSDEYVTVDRLLISALFPESVLEHQLVLALTDGHLTTDVPLDFTVTPVDSPPSISDLGEFNAIEDVVSTFNITQFLSDPDTPDGDLIIIARSDNCTVVGHELQFLYLTGDVTEMVLVQVTDTHSMVEAYLSVTVSERNDAPIVHTMSPRGFTEDEARTIDLSPYIEDEDSPLDSLTVTCDSKGVSEIVGFNVTFLHTTWQPEHTVYFNISDGYLMTEGSFPAQVESVNDPPMITGIADLSFPIVIEVDEGTSDEFPIVVVDEDDHNFKYSISTVWSGMSVTSDGLLEVDAVHGDVGEYEGTLKVEDPSGASGTMAITINVINVNDPPSVPLIIKPTNHTSVELGVNVTFSINVYDPDIMFGQVLIVTWISNVSGILQTRTTEQDLTFVRDDLPIGAHTITVSVTDGEHTSEAWFEIEVIEPYVPPSEKKDEPFITTSTGIGLLVLVVLGVVIAVVMLVGRSRKDGEVETQPTYQGGPIVMDVVDGSQSYEVAANGGEMGRLADGSEGSEYVQPAPKKSKYQDPVIGETLDLEDVQAPTAEELADRQHSVEVREVMKGLTAMPRGLPTSLWGKDIPELARQIVDGPKKKTRDGTMIVEIDGKWYNADHTNGSSFLLEGKEDASGGASGDITQLEREERLAKLEDALLEGNISEEMYERLKNKYQDN